MSKFTILPICIGRNIRNKGIYCALHNGIAPSNDLEYGTEPDQTERKCSPEPADNYDVELSEDDPAQRKAEDALSSNPIPKYAIWQGKEETGNIISNAIASYNNCQFLLNLIDLTKALIDVSGQGNVTLSLGLMVVMMTNNILIHSKLRRSQEV